MASQHPAEPPPSYEHATGRQAPQTQSQQSSGTGNASSHLQVPGQGQNGLTSDRRRSMEDELRPLPKGWVRCFDGETEHQFFVDTTSKPPRSIWHHPYDDEDYLSTLPSAERERIEHETFFRGRQPSNNDILAAHSEDEDAATSPAKGGKGSAIPTDLPPRPGAATAASSSSSAVAPGKGKESASSSSSKPSFGRRFKDKVTGTTHEERDKYRRQRAENEQRMWEEHVALRNAMAEALRTGRPVKVGTDQQGRDVFVEPPRGGPMYGAAQGYPGAGGYPYGGRGYNPYAPPGTYAPPDARFIRPVGPYRRPGGGGYGGGYGLPLAIGGGLLGGMLLGDVLF